MNSLVPVTDSPWDYLLLKLANHSCVVRRQAHLLHRPHPRRSNKHQMTTPCPQLSAYYTIVSDPCMITCAPRARVHSRVFVVGQAAAQVTNAVGVFLKPTLPIACVWWHSTQTKVNRTSGRRYWVWLTTPSRDHLGFNPIGEIPSPMPAEDFQ